VTVASRGVKKVMVEGLSRVESIMQAEYNHHALQMQAK